MMQNADGYNETRTWDKNLRGTDLPKSDLIVGLLGLSFFFSSAASNHQNIK